MTREWRMIARHRIAVHLLAGALIASMMLDTRAALAQQPNKTTVTAAVIGVSVSIWPAIVAKEKGFFTP
jgi:ABC-type nitrate/sulfonate/bicarbonate transport system substrate-binding protein